MLHNWIPPRRFLPYLSSPAIRDLPNKEETVVLLPVAAIEQHGPHLPVAVDTVIVCGVLGRALEMLDDDVPCYCMPPICYGKSNEHVDFAGTVCIDAVTLLNTVMQVCESLYRAGFRKIALVNAHGGQPEVMNIAARDARAAHRDLHMFSLFIWSVPHDAIPLLGEHEARHGIHAGAAETALLLALLPEHVDMTRAVAEYAPADEGLLRLEGGASYAWLTSDISRSGVIGDPRSATPALGHALLEALATSWVSLIRELQAFPEPA